MAWTLEWFRVPSATPSLEGYLRIVRILRQVSRASGISAAPVISDFVPLGAKLQRRYRTPLVFCGKLRAYLCSNIVIGIASTMALKKSQLYSSLWASCDELRGGMDASQYKDYVLVLLFIKYVSDKYAGQPFAPITIPKGASFKDMVALKGKTDIGDQINKKIIAPLANANKLSDMPDFNDDGKLGSGKEKVERLTNLIAIFENKALDFSKTIRVRGQRAVTDTKLARLATAACGAQRSLWVRVRKIGPDSRCHSEH
jgi:hypothetical protein